MQHLYTTSRHKLCRMPQGDPVDLTRSDTVRFKFRPVVCCFDSSTFRVYVAHQPSKSLCVPCIRACPRSKAAQGPELDNFSDTLVQQSQRVQLMSSCIVIRCRLYLLCSIAMRASVETARAEEVQSRVSDLPY